MTIAKCSHCGSGKVTENTSIDGKKPTIKGLKLIICASCGRISYTRGKVKKPPKIKKSFQYVGMSIREALFSGLPVGTVIVCLGINGTGLVKNAEGSGADYSANVNGKVVYFENSGQYAMGWLTHNIISVELPKKQKKTKSK